MRVSRRKGAPARTAGSAFTWPSRRSETLRKWVRQTERDQGTRPGLTTEERQRLEQLERENFELRRANEILRLASAYFAKAEPRPPSEVMRGFIDTHREKFGVEPICEVLPIA